MPLVSDLEIIPGGDKLIFYKKDGNGRELSTTLMLKNFASDQKIFFKIKATHPGIFYVTPSVGHVYPFSVQIIQFFYNQNPRSEKKHNFSLEDGRFLLKVIQKSLQEDVSPAEAWANRGWNKRCTRIYYRCQYEFSMSIMCSAQENNALANAKYFRNDGNLELDPAKKNISEDARNHDKVKAIVFKPDNSSLCSNIKSSENNSYQSFNASQIGVTVPKHEKSNCCSGENYPVGKFDRVSSNYKSIDVNFSENLRNAIQITKDDEQFQQNDKPEECVSLIDDTGSPSKCFDTEDLKKAIRLVHVTEATQLFGKREILDFNKDDTELVGSEFDSLIQSQESLNSILNSKKRNNIKLSSRLGISVNAKKIAHQSTLNSEASVHEVTSQIDTNSNSFSTEQEFRNESDKATKTIETLVSNPQTRKQKVLFAQMSNLGKMESKKLSADHPNVMPQIPSNSAISKDIKHIFVNDNKDNNTMNYNLQITNERTADFLPQLENYGILNKNSSKCSISPLASFVPEKHIRTNSIILEPTVAHNSTGKSTSSVEIKCVTQQNPKDEYLDSPLNEKIKSIEHKKDIANYGDFAEKIKELTKYEAKSHDLECVGLNYSNMCHNTNANASSESNAFEDDTMNSVKNFDAAIPKTAQSQNSLDLMNKVMLSTASISLMVPMQTLNSQSGERTVFVETSSCKTVPTISISDFKNEIRNSHDENNTRESKCDDKAPQNSGVSCSKSSTSNTSQVNKNLPHSQMCDSEKFMPTKTLHAEGKRPQCSSAMAILETEAVKCESYKLANFINTNSTMPSTYIDKIVLKSEKECTENNSNLLKIEQLGMNKSCQHELTNDKASLPTEDIRKNVPKSTSEQVLNMKNFTSEPEKKFVKRYRGNIATSASFNNETNKNANNSFSFGADKRESSLSVRFFKPEMKHRFESGENICQPITFRYSRQELISLNLTNETLSESFFSCFANLTEILLPKIRNKSEFFSAEIPEACFVENEDSFQKNKPKKPAILHTMDKNMIQETTTSVNEGQSNISTPLLLKNLSENNITYQQTIPISKNEMIYNVQCPKTFPVSENKANIQMTATSFSAQDMKHIVRDESNSVILNFSNPAEKFFMDDGENKNTTKNSEPGLENGSKNNLLTEANDSISLFCVEKFAVPDSAAYKANSKYLTNCDSILDTAAMQEVSEGSDVTKSHAQLSTRSLSTVDRAKQQSFRNGLPIYHHSRSAIKLDTSCLKNKKTNNENKETCQEMDKHILLKSVAETQSKTSTEIQSKMAPKTNSLFRKTSLRSNDKAIDDGQCPEMITNSIIQTQIQMNATSVSVPKLNNDFVEKLSCTKVYRPKSTKQDISILNDGENQNATKNVDSIPEKNLKKQIEKHVMPDVAASTANLKHSTVSELKFATTSVQDAISSSAIATSHEQQSAPIMSTVDQQQFFKTNTLISDLQHSPIKHDTEGLSSHLKTLTEYPSKNAAKGNSLLSLSSQAIQDECINQKMDHDSMQEIKETDMLEIVSFLTKPEINESDCLKLEMTSPQAKSIGHTDCCQKVFLSTSKSEAVSTNAKKLAHNSNNLMSSNSLEHVLLSNSIDYHLKTCSSYESLQTAPSLISSVENECESPSFLKTQAISSNDAKINEKPKMGLIPKLIKPPLGLRKNLGSKSSELNSNVNSTGIVFNQSRSTNKALATSFLGKQDPKKRNKDFDKMSQSLLKIHDKPKWNSSWVNKQNSCINNKTVPSLLTEKDKPRWNSSCRLNQGLNSPSCPPPNLLGRSLLLLPQSTKKTFEKQTKKSVAPMSLSNIHQSANNIHQSANNVHQSPKNIHQSTKNIHQSANNIHQSANNVHQSPKNIHQSANNIHQSAKNIHQSAKNIHQSANNIHQSAKNIHQSANNIHQSAKIIPVAHRLELAGKTTTVKESNKSMEDKIGLCDKNKSSKQSEKLVGPRKSANAETKNIANPRACIRSGTPFKQSDDTTVKVKGVFPINNNCSTQQERKMLQSKRPGKSVNVSHKSQIKNSVVINKQKGLNKNICLNRSLLFTKTPSQSCSQLHETSLNSQYKFETDKTHGTPDDNCNNVSPARQPSADNNQTMFQPTNQRNSEISCKADDESLRLSSELNSFTDYEDDNMELIKMACQIAGNRDIVADPQRVLNENEMTFLRCMEPDTNYDEINEDYELVKLACSIVENLSAKDSDRRLSPAFRPRSCSTETFVCSDHNLEDMSDCEFEFDDKKFETFIKPAAKHCAEIVHSSYDSAGSGRLTSTAPSSTRSSLPSIAEQISLGIDRLALKKKPNRENMLRAIIEAYCQSEEALSWAYEFRQCDEALLQDVLDVDDRDEITKHKEAMSYCMNERLFECLVQLRNGSSRTNLSGCSRMSVDQSYIY